MFRSQVARPGQTTRITDPAPVGETLSVPWASPIWRTIHRYKGGWVMGSADRLRHWRRGRPGMPWPSPTDRSGGRIVDAQHQRGQPRREPLVRLVPRSLSARRRMGGRHRSCEQGGDPAAARRRDPTPGPPIARNPRLHLPRAHAERSTCQILRDHGPLANSSTARTRRRASSATGPPPSAQSAPGRGQGHEHPRASSAITDWSGGRNAMAERLSK